MTSFHCLQSCVWESPRVASSNYMIYSVIYGDGEEGGGQLSGTCHKSKEKFNVIFLHSVSFVWYLLSHTPQSKQLCRRGRSGVAAVITPRCQMQFCTKCAIAPWVFLSSQTKYGSCRFPWSSFVPGLRGHDCSSKLLLTLNSSRLLTACVRAQV